MPWPHPCDVRILYIELRRQLCDWTKEYQDLIIPMRGQDALPVKETVKKSKASHVQPATHEQSTQGLKIISSVRPYQQNQLETCSIGGDPAAVKRHKGFSASSLVASGLVFGIRSSG